MLKNKVFDLKTETDFEQKPTESTERRLGPEKKKNANPIMENTETARTLAFPVAPESDTGGSHGHLRFLPGETCHNQKPRQSSSFSFFQSRAIPPRRSIRCWLESPGWGFDRRRPAGPG